MKRTHNEDFDIDVRKQRQRCSVDDLVELMRSKDECLSKPKKNRIKLGKIKTTSENQSLEVSVHGNSRQTVKGSSGKSVEAVQVRDDSSESNEKCIEENEIEYPYDVLSDDHCESPIESYRHISLLLESLSKILQKSPSELRIYDPYYCEGSVINRLASLGYLNVYNKCEDFYQIQQNNAIPEYDVLLTNPPYSKDHIEKLVKFCVKSEKPWLLLLPNYVYMKDYYIKIVTQVSRVTVHCRYLIPLKRYLYTTPKGRRQQKSSKYTSPFPTFWYCGLTRHCESIVQHLKSSVRLESDSNSNNNRSSICLGDVIVAETVRDIPIEIAPDSDPRKKKLRNSLKRSKNKQRKKQKQTSTQISN